jgi:hypothetical protein
MAALSSGICKPARGWPGISIGPVWRRFAVSSARPAAKTAPRSKFNTPSAAFRVNGLTRRFWLTIGVVIGALKIACIGCEVTVHTLGSNEGVD